jgi:hypothetical protein
MVDFGGNCKSNPILVGVFVPADTFRNLGVDFSLRGDDGGQHAKIAAMSG